jgi:hypothetical protein
MTKRTFGVVFAYKQLTMRFLNLIVTLLFLVGVTLSSLAQGSEGKVIYAEKSDISKSITLYPNPTTDYVHVKLGTLKSNQVKLTLHNILGSELAVESEVIDEHELRVRVKDLPTGYYLLAVRDEATQFRAAYKFLKR